MKDPRIEFANNLKAQLIKTGKRQIDLVNDLGFKKSSVSEWCRGIHMPRADQVAKLAQYFNCSTQDLFDTGTPAYDIEPNNASPIMHLLSVAKDANPEDIEMATQLLKRLKGE